MIGIVINFEGKKEIIIMDSSIKINIIKYDSSIKNELTKLYTVNCFTDEQYVKIDTKTPIIYKIRNSNSYDKYIESVIQAYKTFVLKK